MDKIFVFGSNYAGRHGAGAALDALEKYGAVYGKGFGHHGNSYAIPTKDSHINTLPLDDIQDSVDEFKKYAEEHPELSFFVTRIGCGLAGYTDEDIAPMFKGITPNCELDSSWVVILERMQDGT